MWDRGERVPVVSTRSPVEGRDWGPSTRAWVGCEWQKPQRYVLEGVNGARRVHGAESGGAGSAAAPCVAFPGELWAAVRDVGIMTDYVKAGRQNRGRGQRTLAWNHRNW
ncbi:MAG TPA: hypothetical protein PKH07_16295 [bacterium]|nr:hypothetical protein [bacterium]